MGYITRIHYTYADASNWKTSHHVDLEGKGDITDGQIAAVARAMDPEGFIPMQIGWDHAGEHEPTWPSFPSEEDHCWHEIDWDDISRIRSHPMPEGLEKLDDWVARMVGIGSDGWDSGTDWLGNMS